MTFITIQGRRAARKILKCKFNGVYKSRLSRAIINGGASLQQPKREASLTGIYGALGGQYLIFNKYQTGKGSEGIFGFETCILLLARASRSRLYKR